MTESDDGMNIGGSNEPIPLAQLARDLVNTLDSIHADPAYKAVWQHWQIHHGPYTGPNYSYELETLRDRLNLLSR